MNTLSDKATTAITSTSSRGNDSSFVLRGIELRRTVNLIIEDSNQWFFRGEFEVYVKNQQTGQELMMHVYDNRGAFGELALLYNMPRAATIKAVTPGTLWAMDRQTFRRILLKSAYKKCKMYEDLINRVPMLKSIEASVADNGRTVSRARNNRGKRFGTQREANRSLEHRSLQRIHAS